MVGSKSGLSVGIWEVITIQVRLVVKIKGRNEKKTVPHEKSYNLQGPQSMGAWMCSGHSVRVMQFTSKMIC